MNHLEATNQSIMHALTAWPKADVRQIRLEIQALQASALVAIARELHHLTVNSLPSILFAIRDLIQELKTARGA